MGKDIEPANIPVWGCLVSFCLGIATWCYFLWARTLPETDSAPQGFAIGYPLFVLAAGALLTGLFGAGLLPYAIFSKTRGPLCPIFLKCGVYLVPTFALVVAYGMRFF